MWGYLQVPEEETRPYWVAESGIRMMKRFAAQRRPWHLWISFLAPHDPYMPLKKYLDRYDPARIPVPQSFYDTFEGKPSMHKKESETWGVVTEDDYRQSRAHYYAYCEETDAQIGRILDALEATGQAANTLVTFSADHGDMVGAHRMWIKDWIPYEECHRIPMVMRWPARIRPGLVTQRLVQLHDLAYTYLEAAGAKSLPYQQGRSLQPLAEDPERRDWPDHVLSAYYGDEYLHTQRMVITDRYKYVFQGIAMDECYDLQEDPQEMHNLLGKPNYQEVIDDMRARLYELMDQFGDPYGDVGTKLPDSYAPSLWGAPRYLPRGKRSLNK
jgi:arylsulfatase A-like enzyme